jgi:hypothetical protein
MMCSMDTARDTVGTAPRYDRVVYLAAPAARGVVGRAAASLPGGQRDRLVVRDLPPGAAV